MSDIAIQVENLSKRYSIGKTIKHSDGRKNILQNVAAPFRYLASTLRPPDYDEILWALKDVSFEVRQSEVVGIIGRNGSGKSTLLKILSRITEPTSGRALINGRVGSLLEVGTGFHPELTGRENIYLNGAILGMKRAEVEGKFEEIVDFSGIEKFIDTPVKRYSSGMYVRLAFAVAASLEPDVLLVDEVLAVGDAAFQKKCLGKMGEVAKEGRTVLFVSHQLAMINTLCESVMLLDKGELIEHGPTSQIVEKYLSGLIEESGTKATVTYSEDLFKKAQLLTAALSGEDGQPAKRFDVFDKITLAVTYVIREPIIGASIIIVVRRNGEVLFVSFETDDQPQLLETRLPGTYSTSAQLPNPLKAGRYSVDINFGILKVGGVDIREEALQFDVEEWSFNTSMRAYSSQRPGVMAAHLNWYTDEIRDKSST
jgi:lipopolysaccharide transport system ATP-binding protein